MNEHIVTELISREYFVDGEWIKPTPSKKFKLYNPFDFYNTNENRVIESPHVEFANLNYLNPDEVSDFCSKWGLLGIVSRDFDCYKKDDNLNTIDNYVAVNWRDNKIEEMSLYIQLQGYNDLEQFEKARTNNELCERLDLFQIHCQYFQSLMKIKSAIVPFDENKIFHLRDNWENPNHFSAPNFKLNTDIPEEISAQFASYLYERIFAETKFSIAFFPLPVVNKKTKGGSIEGLRHSSICVSYDLFTSMFIMLYLDLFRGTYTRRCEKCNRWFETVNTRAKYCSSDHQHAAKSLRNYKKKHEPTN